MATLKHYLSKDITIFPSSNAADSGKIFTELNGRNITLNIVDKNYVISPNPGGFSLTLKNGKINIAAGKAYINGFEIDVTSDIDIDLPTEEDVVEEGDYSGIAILCLHTVFDAQENISGNIQEAGSWICEGIQITYPKYEDYIADKKSYLLLGGVSVNGDEIVTNPDLFTKIDAKSITIDIEPHIETGVPPKQETNLYNFINNILKSYWVSKAGDSEFGDLVFRTEPANYKNKNYNYTDESVHNNEDFSVKIFNKKHKVVVKDENNTSEAIATDFVVRLDEKSLTFNKEKYSEETPTKEYDATIQAASQNSGNYFVNFVDENLDNNTETTGINILNKRGYIVISSLAKDSSSFTPSLTVSRGTHIENNNILAVGGIYASNNNSNNPGIGKTINYLCSPHSDDIAVIYSANLSTGSTTNPRDASTNTESYKNGVRLCAYDKQSNDANSYGGRVIISSSNDAPNYFAKIELRHSDTENNSSSVSLIQGIPNSKTNIDPYFKNAVNVKDNLLVSSDSTAGGNICSSGFIYSGYDNNTKLTDIKVPDIANSGNTRSLKKGDIYGKQVWSAVYNDYAEIFELNNNTSVEKAKHCVIALDKKTNKYTIASKENNIIVGIASENPAYCAGGDNTEHGIPVALTGRVKVKYSGKLKLGDFVKLSKIEGHVCKGHWFSKNRCGKVTKIIDNNLVEVLVLL